MPFLSFIIPVYNAERYLSHCLDSLLPLAECGIEIILVDDGSKDSSAELCRAYEQKYDFIKLLQKENSGPSAARNFGLDRALGEYIVFVDSDDYVDSDALTRHAQQLHSNPVDVWVSDFHRVADNGCVLDRVYQIEKNQKAVVGKEYLTQFLSAKDCVWNVWRYIFRREFLERNNFRFAEGFHCAEDLEFAVRALNAAESMAFLHEPYYFYRVNYGASLTRSYSHARVHQLMTMLQQAAKTLGESKESKLLKAKLSREYILNLSLLYEVPKAKRKAVLDELKTAKWLMADAVGVYSMVACAVKMLGISVSSGVLYLLKRLKRLTREVKTRRF